MVPVCCEFTVSFIIGSYFFKEPDTLGSVTVTVTGQRYEYPLRNHVIPALQQRGCGDRIIFMQGGASPYIASPAKQLLKRYLGYARIIRSSFLYTMVVPIT